MRPPRNLRSKTASELPSAAPRAREEIGAFQASGTQGRRCGGISPVLRYALLAAVLVWSQIWAARHDAQHAGAGAEHVASCAWCVYGGGPQALPGPSLQLTLVPPAEAWLASLAAPAAIAQPVGVYRSRAPPVSAV
ncbi:MAG: hypothetical protein JWQ90_4589 [Hydrocarboniphaga sp.]|uniref:hypothetical protein n=1 Tax=Hydrocarboniphaga sp. TaxID=2033016 RepID=UPI002601CCDC|nr:hypothetical protein [Hydrocarboniphaga sp.]MDB5972139.1 hypothetical protein [Hydrocarboniphaga sp.]